MATANLQRVYVGRLQSGAFALFTNRMLVWPLTPAEASNRDFLLALCRRCEFELVEA